MKSSDNLVWLDMEMTGLDEVHDTILEVAMFITDKNFTIISEEIDLVLHVDEKVLGEMNDWSKEQHAKSGLLDRVRNSSLTIEDAEKKMVELLEKHCVSGKAVLCGNSVHFDRRFLRRWMPTIDNFLHYRLIDVSTIKELAFRLYPNIGEYNKKKTHRALDDIKESLAELKFYQEKIFV